LIGDKPGKEEWMTGQLWSGRAGDVLKDELRRAGITFGACRTTNMWMHNKTHTDAAEYETCKNFMLTNLFKEMEGRKAVLLMGAEVVSFFCPGFTVSQLNGLRVESGYIKKGVIAVACLNPGTALRDKVGEVRLAIQKFGKMTKEVR
jgi:uracil-DNA glycosylase family 4